ncbi:MAG: hypothetical protein EP330_04565 [Deltaproteobacteria bacterium]|nr:MAG: hypothetical protein EP330_04565 [Deltaproteobacteria bacterium]
MQIARFGAAPVVVTRGFFALTALLYLVSGAAMPGLVGALLWLPMIAGSVLVHELGHAYAARANSRKVREIQLNWHGGHCVHEGLPLPPVMFRVALAGPAASLGLAVVAFFVSLLPLGPWVVAAASTLFALNLSWAVFNLIPVKPFDGGHALAALTGRR